jgi:uncharacterized protein YndB with AHSA1/START domain
MSSIHAPAEPGTLEHEIRAPVPSTQVMEALTTDAGLSAWYGSGMEASEPDSGHVVFHVPPHPRFRWTVERPSSDRLVWRCVEGPGRSVGTEAIYEVGRDDTGRTTVRLTHRGWDEDDDAFRRCNTYWGALLYQLQRYLLTGEKRPIFAAED